MILMRVGIAADHGGFALKQILADALQSSGYETVDFGAHQLDSGDDYPDFVIPLARAVAEGRVDRGVALCGSGVGASVAANKVAGVRAALVHDVTTARLAREHNHANVLCLGARVLGTQVALDCVAAWLDTSPGEGRHLGRLDKIAALDAAR